MKKRLTYLFIATTLVLTGGLSSCDKITDLLETTLEDVLYPIFVSAEITPNNDGANAFRGTSPFDSSDSEGNELVGQIIHGVDLKSVKLVIDNFTYETELEIFDAVIEIKDDVSGESLIYSIPAPVSITPFMEFEIPSSTSNYNVVTDIIQDLHAATVTVNGHISEDDVDLAFMVYIVADITIGLPE